jgi:hypothetical protein
MRTSHRLVTHTILPLVLLLTACNDNNNSGQSSAPSLPTTETTLHTLTLASPTPNDGEGVAVDPAIDNGLFTIDWRATSSDPYRIDVAINHTADVDSDDTALWFHGQNCGSDNRLYACDFTSTLDCHFTTANMISCGVVNGANPASNLTDWLNELPQTATITVRVCDSPRLSCDAISRTMVLR